jgi:hypothetical protein
LTDFGLATGALNPAKIESMKNKVITRILFCRQNPDVETSLTPQLDQVKDENLVIRSTLERKTMYKSMRMAEPRYVSAVSVYMEAHRQGAEHSGFAGGFGGWVT